MYPNIRVKDFLSSGLKDVALEQAQAAVEENPLHEPAWCDLVNVYLSDRDFVSAVESARCGLERFASSVTLLRGLAIASTEVGDYETARQIVRVLSSEGSFHRPWCCRMESTIAFRSGDLSGSERALSAIPLEHRNAEWTNTYCTSLIARNEFTEAETILQDLIRQGSHPPTQAAWAYFQISKIRDRTGDYDGAWEYATKAHGLIPSPASMMDVLLNHVHEIRNVMNRESLEMWAKATNTCSEIILIVGMARSGTSLLEQILSAHPDVASAGELVAGHLVQRKLPLVTDSYLTWPNCIADLTTEDANKLQQTYRSSISGLLENKSKVTDKSLSLVFQLGLLHCVLPGAKAILLRRNPLDVIVSCYTTPLVLSGHYYASNLKMLATMWQVRNALQDFWMENLDPIPHNLNYENLVEDLDTETRKLLDYLGLAWDDRCLRFHENDRVAKTISFDQVNRAIYKTSVERWRRYEKHLGPAMDVLNL